MAQWDAPYELRKLQIRYSRAPVGIGTQDVCVTTHHFLNLTDDAPDDTWDAGDYGAVEAALATYFAALKIIWPTWLHVDQYRWYRDGPAFHPTPAEGNPADRVTEVDIAGTLAAGSGVLPPQTAISVTEKTALRKRWGRYYLPAGATSTSTQYGLLLEGTRDLVADASEAFYNTCRAADLIPVVFSPTTESSWSVDAIQVDDLFDVIRSRRWSSPSNRDPRILAAI